MENNFIQMAAFNLIFKHIIDCMQLYFPNNFNCLWLDGVTVIFDGTLTNNSPTVSDRSSEVAKQYQLWSW